MRFFLSMALCELCAVFRSKKTLLFLCALPVCLALAAAAAPENLLQPAVPVGICVPEGSERGGELLELLRENAGVIEFIPADEDTLRRSVASGQWECGYILRDDFDERCAARRYSRLFTLVISDGSSVHGLVSEAVSSAMLVLTAPDIGSDYLESAGAVPPDGGWTLDDWERLEIVPASGSSGVPAGTGDVLASSLLRSAAAVMLTVIAAAFGDALAIRRRSHQWRALAALRGETALMLPVLAVRFALLFAIAELSLLALGEGSRPGLLAALCLALAGLCDLLTNLPGGWSAAALPFLPVAMLILCPVLFDVAAIMPSLAPVSDILAATHYLRGELSPLLMQAAVFFFAAAALRRLNKI